MESVRIFWSPREGTGRSIAGAGRGREGDEQGDLSSLGRELHQESRVILAKADPPS